MLSVCLFCLLAGAVPEGATGTPLDGGSLLPSPQPFQPQVSDPLLEPAPRAAKELASWDEARTLLHQNAIDERNAAAAVERAQGRWKQSLSALLPNARGSVGVTIDALNPTTTSLIGVNQNVLARGAPTSPMGSLRVDLTQSIVDLSAWRGLSAADAARDVAKWSREDIHRRLTQGLARSLVAVVAAERVAELNRIGFRQALERAALITRTAQLGAATQVDVVRTRQDVDVARGALIAGDEQLRRTREALGVALGVDSEVGVPSGFVLDGLADEARAVCRKEERADLLAARANVESARDSRKQASLGYLPSLGLTSNLFGFTTDPGVARFATWNIAATISVPIWEGGLREGLVREREGVQAQAEAALEQSRRQVRLEIAQAQRQVGVAEALVSAAQGARNEAAQLDALTRRAFEVGRGSSLELVQSAGVLRQADVVLATREFELVQARLDVLMTEARCDW